MRDYELARIVNKNKHLLKVGDIVISKTYGIGKIIEIEMYDDVLLPILVQFECFHSFPCNCIKTITKWYDCNGVGSSENDTIKFYRELDVKNDAKHEDSKRSFRI